MPISLYPTIHRPVHAALLLLCCASCVDTASKSNDSTQSAAGASGATAAASGAGGSTAGGSGAGGRGAAAAGRAAAGNTSVAGRAGTAGHGGAAGATGTASAQDDAGVESDAAVGAAGDGAAGEGAGGEGAAGEAAAGEGAAGDGAAGEGAAGDGAAGASGPPPVVAPDPSLVTGTGEGCQSYTAPMNGMCAGWFCGVNQETLTKAVDPAAKCGGDVELLCRGATVTAVGRCAREIKSAMVSTPDEELRPLIEACVYEDAEIQQKVPRDCLSCTIDAAQCAGQLDTCLLDCLSSDSPACDSCRRQNQCDQMVFSCGGLPAPIQ